MILRFLLSFTMIAWGFLLLNAQKPANILVEKASKQTSISAQRLACDNYFAGRVASITAVSAQSNDIDLDTTYLCRGDEVFLDHAGDFNLSDDPTPTTPPGIGYVFYNCRPTVSGPSLTSIRNDPCTNVTSPILVGTQLIYQTNGVWVASENVNGDINLANDGIILRAFGGTKPVQMWFAPITLDEFATQGFYQNPVSGEIGPCVNANVNAAFTVVYLQPIQAVNRIFTAAGNGCQGSFVVEGGLPQFRTGATYAISITKVGSPAIRGSVLSGPARHGSKVEFTVPEPGFYDISIEDGKSCGQVFRMDFTTCNGIRITSSNEVVRPGDRVCTDVIVSNFSNVLSMQFTMEFDPNVLQYDGFVVPSPTLLPGLDAGGFGESFATVGAITFSWNNVNPNQGITLPDGSVIFRICFIAKAQNVRRFSPIKFTGSITPVEIRNPRGDNLGFDNTKVGRIFVSNRTIETDYQLDTACYGQSNGGFTVSAFGGTAPYAVLYRNLTTGTQQQGPFVINIDGGTYSVGNQSAGRFEVVVSDNTQPPITITDTIEVAERLQLDVVIDTVKRISCFGDSDGALIARVFEDGVEVNDPSSNYLFEWNTGATTRVISNLSSRLYAITLTDQYGCKAFTNRRLETPAVIDFTTAVDPASCTGKADGVLQITSINGGTTANGNYRITITGPGGFSFSRFGNTANINGVRDGNYLVKVTDDNNCEAEVTIEVPAQRILSVIPVVKENVSCKNGSDGQIFLKGLTTPGPASTPYTFQWISTPPVPGANIRSTDSTSTIFDVRARSYQLILTDRAGCRFDTSFTITEPDSVRASILNLRDETCSPGRDGQVTLSATGGTALGGRYTYTWASGSSNSPTITNLTAGNYVVTVSDDNNCTDTLQFSIKSPNPPQILSFENDTLPCANSTNGSLTVNARAGNAPIANYSWSNGQSGANRTTLTNLSPGSYSVTVSASDGCTAVDTALVIAPANLVVDSFLTNRPTCPGDANGAILLYLSGGTQPYTFTWSNNPASPSGFPVLAGLTAGSYTVTVVDANNCTPLVRTFSVSDPPSIQVQVTITDTVSCFGISCDGGASASARYSNGANGTFSFIWSSGETGNGSSNAASQLCQGNQAVTVNDGTCGVVIPVTVPSRQPLVTQVAAKPASCNGLADGEATLTITGGEGPFRVVWDNGTTGTTATGLRAGTYVANVTDVNGCTFSTSVVITEPGSFTLSVDLTVTRDVTCYLGADGLINVNALGGNSGNITYAWAGNVASAFSNLAPNLKAGTYSVTATDSRGCQATATHTINQPPPIVFALDSIPPIQCFGFPTTVRPANVSGGNGGAYAYSLDNAPLQDVSFPTNIFAGTHTITIYDSKNCTVDIDFTVQEPNPIVINLPPTIEIELGASGTLNPVIVPGGPPINTDSIFWSPATFLSCDRCLYPVVTPLEPTLYTLTVYDRNGCEASAQIQVEVDKNRNVYLPNIFSPNGDGINDEFRIFTGPGVQQINYVRLFDRWGDIVFEKTNLSPDNNGIPTWDGFFRGKAMDPAVFVYLVEVEFLDGIRLLYRGDVTLLR